MKKANSRAKLPDWFVTKYKHDLRTTSASQLKQTPNLILVGLGTEQDPDLPPQLFNDLGRLAKETRQTVEGIFALEPTGRRVGGEAGKFTVQPDGTVLQDSTATGDSMYLRKNHFSGPNALQPLS
jgi:hypothetical protein